MGMKVSMRFVAPNGVAKAFDIGFIPDEVRAFRDLDGGNDELEYWWLRVLADAENDGQYGIAYNASGVPAKASDADNGIIPYTEGEDNAVLITHPDTGKLVRASVADWKAATSYASGARSITVVGTIVRPPIHNGRVFELTTATGSGTSEPTDGWDVQPGETVTDGGSNIWTARKEIMTKGGGLGFQIGATLLVDGDEWAFTAEQHDKYEDVGDTENIDPMKFSEGRADA